MFRIGRG
jgi:hypothetical protein